MENFDLSDIRLQASALIDQYIGRGKNPNDFFESHADELRFFIKVSGADYNASFPASFANALLEIQKNFYKTVAYSLYGKADIRKLTKQELKNYELVFTVKTGSSEFFADIADKIISLISNAMKDMEPLLKAKFTLAFILIITLGYAAGCYIGEQGETERAKIAQEQQAAQEATKQLTEQEETKRLALALQAPRGGMPTAAQILDYAGQISEENRQTVLKNARTAESVQYGNKHYSAQEIQEFNQKSERGELNAKVETGIYRIVISNFRDSDVLRFTLADTNGGEVSAALDTSQLDADSENLLWQSIQSRRSLKLTITKTYSGKNLLSALISRIEPVSE